MEHFKDYEKIKTVGKGAFGTAYLYRKIKTNQLVVIKEINTNDLSITEKQMALNEVDVLSSLHHPNIIAYSGSFIHEGTLMIEMEYADGGNLSQHLASRDQNMPEREILSLMHQISAAIVHMHLNNILHRDLKTANVFMNSNGTVKIGDFGISKILTTNAQAQTVLGTPYYISPEMCEGKDYGEKSDIWAMGCILYEMCCLHRTFQASTLPALVNKIMKGDYKPIPPGYSEKLSKLVRELLNKNPEKRPTAEEIHVERIPTIIESLGKSGYKYIDPYHNQSRATFEMSQFTQSKIQEKVERSVLYQVKSFETSVNIYPIQLPPKAKVTSISTGHNHFIVVTDENLVYTWGEGSKGQLGHGVIEQWRHYPLLVQDLVGKQVVMCSAGKGFTVFLTSGGTVLSCGDGSSGALGHGNWNDYYKPRPIESILDVHILSISCGTSHVAAMSKEGKIYTWGRGDKGQTGQGTTSNSCQPKKVCLLAEWKVISINCGGEATMVITSKGTAFTCGWNKNNKLASTNNKKSIKNLLKQESDIVLTLTKVSEIPGYIIACSVGVMHCAFYVRLPDGTSAVYTTGCPLDFPSPQTKTSHSQFAPARIYDLDNVEISIIECGPSYTIVGTVDNCILQWGIRYGLPDASASSSKDSQDSSGVWSHHSSFTKKMEQLNSSSTSIFTDYLMSTYQSEIIKRPIPLLGLYSSPSQIDAGSFVTLHGLYPLAHSILLLVKTTAPLLTLGKNTAKETKQTPVEDCDSIGPLPDWMKAEVAVSKFSWKPL